jgi:uncharacterized SAM-binding protein YcdF (DUF218 family)
MEPRSRTTLENATETAKLLAARTPTTIVLVTDGYHALRARLLFRIAGLRVICVRSAEVPWRPRLLMAATESLKLPISVICALLHAARAAK